MSGIHGNLSTGSILRDFYTSGVCNTYKRYKKFTPQTFFPNKTLLISRRQAHQTKQTVFCIVCCSKLFAKRESRPFMVTVICLVLSSNICRHLPPIGYIYENSQLSCLIHVSSSAYSVTSGHCKDLVSNPCQTYIIFRFLFKTI